MNAKLLFLPLALGLSVAPTTAVFPQTLGIYPPLQRLQLADTRQLDVGTRSIIVNPVPSDLRVNLELDRHGSNPIYRPGEPIAITLSTNRDAYVYLFSIQADGRTHLILPNRFSGGNEFLRAGEVRTFPPPGASYRLTIAPPFGQAQVLAVASPRPLNFQEIASFEEWILCRCAGAGIPTGQCHCPRHHRRGDPFRPVGDGHPILSGCPALIQALRPQVDGPHRIPFIGYMTSPTVQAGKEVNHPKGCPKIGFICHNESSQR